MVARTLRPAAFVLSLVAALVVGLVAFLTPSSAMAKPRNPPSSDPTPPLPPLPKTDEGPAPKPASSNPLHFTDGPASIDLGHALTLALPATDQYLGAKESALVLEKMGNLHNEGLLGIVAPKAETDNDWFVVITFSDEGHIKDDEKVDADALLKSLREGQEQANEERKEKGFKALTIDGWQVPPAYDKEEHHLSWALIVGSDTGKSVNFHTRILGRTGLASIVLVTDPDKLAGYRGEATAILEATTFAKGSRYSDFDSKKDKVAEYGLAGLILGGAGLGVAKLVKIGLLAKFGKVIFAGLIAAKKAVVVALAAVAGFIKKLFGGKKAATPQAGAPTRPTAPTPPQDGPPAV